MFWIRRGFTGSSRDRSERRSTPRPNERYLYTADDERLAVRTSGEIVWTIRDLDNAVVKTWSSSPAGNGTWQWLEEYAYRGS